MKKLLVAAVFALSAGVAQAASFTVETNNWTKQNAPANNGNSGGNWSTGGTSASRGANASTSLISDFNVLTDFVFTGTMRATADNDNMGIVFNWTDASNHYRMGWEGGGYSDTGSSTQQGFWLIRESGGVDTVLANTPSLFWSRNVDYDFRVARTGSTIAYEIKNGASTVVSGAVNDGTFTTGKVGVYQESNYTRFSNLAVNTPSPAAVPVPAALPLLGAGLGLLGAVRARRKS